MKKALIILLAILAVAGMLSGCNTKEDDEMSEIEKNLVTQLMADVDWYNEKDTHITIHHAYAEEYIIIAVHKYNDKEVGVDTYKTYRNLLGQIKYTCIDQTLHINKGTEVRDNEKDK
jgi:hypothetical protein